MKDQLVDVKYQQSIADMSSASLALKLGRKSPTSVRFVVPSSGESLANRSILAHQLLPGWNAESKGLTKTSILKKLKRSKTKRTIALNSAYPIRMKTRTPDTQKMPNATNVSLQNEIISFSFATFAMKITAIPFVMNLSMTQLYPKEDGHAMVAGIDYIARHLLHYIHSIIQPIYFPNKSNKP